MFSEFDMFFWEKAIRRSLENQKQAFHQLVFTLIFSEVGELYPSSMFKFQRIAWSFIKKYKFFSEKKPHARRLGACGLVLLPLAVYMTNDQIWSFSFSPSSKKQAESQPKTFTIPDDVRRMANKQKMILVIDLDQTMVYSRREVMPPHENYLLVDIKERQETILVQFRPYLPQFLQAVSQLFTLYVYTAGTQEYADAVLDAIPNGQLIQKRFYREDCAMVRGNLVKKLTEIRKKQKLGEEKVLVLVDDNKRSISLNKPNSILISPFEGDQKDEKFLSVFQQLIEFYRKNMENTEQIL